MACRKIDSNTVAKEEKEVGTKDTKTGTANNQRKSTLSVATTGTQRARRRGSVSENKMRMNEMRK